MIDRTGQPRTDEEIDEAINCIETVVIKHAIVIPTLTVQESTIRDCLIELRGGRLEDTADKRR